MKTKSRCFNGEIFIEIFLIVLSLWMMTSNTLDAVQAQSALGMNSIAYRAWVLTTLSAFVLWVFVKQHLNKRKIRANQNFDDGRRGRHEEQSTS